MVQLADGDPSPVETVEMVKMVELVGSHLANFSPKPLVEMVELLGSSWQMPSPTPWWK